MKTAVYKIDCNQGATFSLSMTWQNVDLTDCTARMKVKDRIGGETLIELTTENGRILLGGEAGTILLFISDEDTTALPALVGRYDLEIEFANGEVERLIEGQFNIRPEVTT